MYGIKAVLTLGLLLTAADARPEGYGGVKGGRSHKSTANAFASAQATANADGGYLGAAQSSASATAQSSASATAQSSASATANAFASGGSSNAAATANAYADGGNIGKVIWSDDANGNANPLGDSDDLRLSSAHAKDSENQSDNQEDGTFIGSHHNAHTGSYGNGGSAGVTGQGQDLRPGCGVPAGVKGHRGASGCTDGNGAEENKPSGSNAHPTYNGNPDSSGGSKYPTSLDGGYGGNHAGAQPCTSGASGCPKNKPSVSNPYPTYNGNPDVSGGSKYPTSLDGGYGGNHAGAQPCTSGASGCPKNTPSVSNPHPTNNGNPDLSAGSKYPTSLDGGYGGNHAGAQPCTSGASGCPKNKPSVSNPYPTYNGNPDLSGGSKYPTNLDGGYGGNHAGAQPCTSGASGCPKNKPSVSNPHPTYNENPDLSAGSNLDGGYGGNHAGVQPCTSGASGCPKNKPSVSNPYPTYNGNPDLSAGSNLDGGYGGNHAGVQPCTSGASGCPKNTPSVSNPHPTYNGNPDLSAGSKYPPSLDGGYGGIIAKPEPPSCSGGAPGCSGNKPSVSNPHAVHPVYAESPDSQHKVDINHGQVEGDAGRPQDTPCFPGDPRCLAGSKPKPTTPDPSTAGVIQYGPNPCTSGSINCPQTRRSVANPYPSHQENPDLSGGSKYPTNPNGDYGGKTPTAGEHPSSGWSQYPGSSRKPDTSNPFLNGKIDVSDIKNSVNTGVGSGIKTNPENPFLNPHSQVRPSTDTKHPEKPNGSYGGSPTAPVYPYGGSGDSPSSTLKTNPSNPFLSHNGNVDSPNHVQQNTNLPTGQGHPATNGGCHGTTGCGSNEPGHPTGSSEYPVNKPNPVNPFLSHNGNVDSTYGINHPGVGSGFPQNTNLPTGQGHPATNGGCHGTSGCGSNEPGHPTGSSEYPVNKPNPANPFLSHNGNVDSPNNEQQNTNVPTGQGHPATNGGCHGSTGCWSNEPGHPTGSSEYPVNKPNPSNPTGTKYPDLKLPVLKNPGSFGESSYDRIDPHSNNKNHGSQDLPATNGGCHGTTGCASNKPGHPTDSSEYPVNKPNPANPFLSHNGNVDSPNNEQQNTNVPTGQGHPATNGGCHGTIGCGSNEPGHPTGSSEYPVNKPNPSNPTGTKYPDLKLPVLKNPGSFGESSYDFIDPHSNKKNHGSQDLPSMYPGQESIGSNPDLGDGQLTNPHPKPGSHETPNSPKPFPGHNTAESPSTEWKPEVGDVYHGNGNPHGTEDQAKTHQPGVKGGSRRREPPAKLQGSELPSGNTGSAYSAAHASASASAHSSAFASSSSSSGGGHSSAKSDAYSDFGISETSNSWASSSASASASASAFASSSSHQGPESSKFPDVPAE